MTNISRSAVLLATLFLLPFVAGCFTSGGGNPLGVSPTVQNEDMVSAAAETAQISAAKVVAKTSPIIASKKYSYAPPPHKFTKRLKPGIKLLPGCFRVKFKGDSAESVFVTLGDMKVKNVTGRPYNVPLPNREIDLKATGALTELLAELNLPAGVYNYLEFKVKSARVVFSGVSYPAIVPTDRIRFLGRFEIKDGFTTELMIKFQKKLVLARGFHKRTYILTPIVRISSVLVPNPDPPAATTGDITGTIIDYVKKTPISGVTVTIGGPLNNSTTTDAAGSYSFNELPPGTYTISLIHPDYLDKSFAVNVSAGQVTETQAEMNPAVILSSVGNTGWFSNSFPLADAHGQYGEVALETPINIDFVSLAFTKVELSFDSEYQAPGMGYYFAYLSSTQQLQIITNLGGWWVGNNATLGQSLGQFYSTNPPTNYVINITDYVRNNPSNIYYMAARNMSAINMRMTNIQMAIYYR